MNKTKTILMSFLSHRETDGRVFYREVRYLIDEFGDDICIKIISMTSSKEYNDISVAKDLRYFSGAEIEIFRICTPHSAGIIDQTLSMRNIHKVIRKLLAKIAPDIYFIADVRELRDAIYTFRSTNTTVLYDSHEDYVRQALDYGTGIKKYVKAITFFADEVTCIRKCESVFCTDEFLLEKYNKPIYKAKKVHLMRNYPYYDSSVAFDKTFKSKTTLKMVYIGGVDRYRGIIESANYIERFNSENNGLSLTMDIYGNDTEVAQAVRNNIFVQFHGWIDQNDLMKKLRTEYDVGLCLWQPIPKFFLNLPIKNFDYMGAGLPFITSNFGNLKIHAEKSKAGYCIDPNSYEEFKEAVLELFNATVRERLSMNGISYAKYEASFQAEAKPFIDIIRTLLFKGVEHE